MEHYKAVELGCIDTEYPVLNEETNEFDIFEPEYFQSYTAITFHDFKEKKQYSNTIKQINDLMAMAKCSVANAIKASPCGLTDKSIIDRMSQKQFAFSTVVRKFYQDNEPELYKRLFRKETQEGHLLWNYMMACSIRAMDEVYNEKFGDKDGEEVMIHITKEDNGQYKIVEVDVD